MAESNSDAGPNHLTGNFFVRRLDSAIAEVNRDFRSVRDRIEIRRQALKLRYWPAPATEDASGRLIDLDWSYIRALHDLKIGELRIHRPVGGHANIRIIFFVGPPNARLPKPCIWILSVFAKKRDDFTTKQIEIFHARREIVLARYYR